MFGNNNSTQNKKATFDIVVCHQSTVEGTINSSGSVRVDGVLNGDLTCSGNLIVGERAQIKGAIKAISAEVAGNVEGNITLSGNLTLSAGAKVNGDVSAAGIRIEEGATFEGRCSIKVTKNSSLETPKQNSTKNE